MPQQYKAWCKHDGEHKTANKAYSSWNADLLEPVEDDLGRAWEQFDLKTGEVGQLGAESLKSVLDSIRAEFQGKFWRLRALYQDEYRISMTNRESIRNSGSITKSDSTFRRDSVIEKNPS